MTNNMTSPNVENTNLAILEFALRLHNHQKHLGDDFWEIVDEVSKFVYGEE